VSDGFISPALSAERLNDNIMLGWRHFEETLRLYIRNYWQSGYGPGEVPAANESEELEALMADHERNMMLMFDPNADEGDRYRAQRALMREEDLMMR